MGFCSGTEIFDPMAEYVLKMDWLDSEKIALLVKLIDALENHDWDCQSDSAYYEHPIVRQAFIELHPDWFTEEPNV